MKPARKGDVRGVTLIELLVVIALLGIVLSLIVNFLSLQSRAASVQKAIDEANEASRVALSLVTWDLQNAGFEVPVSIANPAVIVPNANVAGHRDTFTIRYFDEASETAQRVTYDVASSPGTLRRAQYADDPSAVPSQAPTVAEVVALNVLFETRDNQFIDPVSPGECPVGSTLNSTGDRCVVEWLWQDEPSRLIRRVRIEMLSRSERRVARYEVPTPTYTFTGASGATTTYAAEPGYAYDFTTQVVSTPNLGR